METQEKKRKKDMTWSKVAQAYMMDLQTLHTNLKPIRAELDAIAGRTNYRKLTPRMLILIEHQLGPLNY